MLDVLLGRGFSSKCKSWIKMTKTRLEVIMRRRNAMQRYLKKDIADLLANGLDTNAYSRAQGLSIELNLSSCYEFLAQICDNIPIRLSLIKKQRECPEDCREAISSLIFAAARFADLPELRHLRDIFTERYGKTLEPFVNKEFVENLASNPPASEKKLQLMREIAKEFSIKWDSKAVEQKIANSRLHLQDGAKIEENKLYNSHDGVTPKRENQDSRDGATLKRENQDVSSTGRQGLSNVGYTLHRNRGEATLDRDKLNVNGRQGLSDDPYRLHSEGRETISENVNQDVSSHRRWEVSDDQYKQHGGSKQSILETDIEYIGDGFKPHQASAGTESMKSLPPPPYLKPNGGKYTPSYATSYQANKDGTGRSEKAQTGLDHVDYDESRREVGLANLSGDDNVDCEDVSKPKSVRRRHLKPPTVQEYEVDKVVKRDPNGRRGEDIRQALDKEHGSKDEEKLMDKLLIHYSKKASKFEAPINPDAFPPPSRAVSLPPEPATPTGTGRAPARATSFQPDMTNPDGHVHPRLPDYDDLAARIAALRGG